MTKQIEVYADWIGLNGPEHIGRMTAQSIRGAGCKNGNTEGGAGEGWSGV